MKAKSRQETIRHDFGNSSLGTVLVAATEKGICALLIGDDPAELAAELQRRFPDARLTGGDESLHRLLDRAVSHVEDPKQAWDPPLDLRGTPFQQRVWKELRKIPAGSTGSYSGIAEKIRSPGAVRAVAGACAANHVAVAVPCHRVLRSDGGLSGYRWGVERKRALLDREANA
jgi:AraC family transcriptional regulator of adaptative response/methylated-DNA-[protein]-cysteine methyltransferase